MKIYLIRHGESTSDIDNLYGGDYDDHLSKKGKKQAIDLASKLKNNKIEIIFSSPRLRAKETSEILQKSLKCKLEIINDLRERNFYGILTGMNKEEAKKLYPKHVELLKSFKNTIEGAEDYKSFKKRIENSLNKIINKDNKIIVIVTHGGPISLIFREFFNKEIKKLSDCAVIEFKYDGKLKIIKTDGVDL